MDNDALSGPRASILLLGTFHFQDRGLDQYKPRSTFDVFSPHRQKEIEEVVNLLEAYRPTKVAVERTPAQQADIDAEYKSCLAGKFDLPGDEVYQVGFRLAKRLGHERVYAANAWDRHYEPQVDIDAYAREHGQERLLSDWWPRFERLLEQSERTNRGLSLRQILLRMNDPARVMRLHGVYLVDRFKVGAGAEYPGVDLVTGWYNRNLRIFANLERMTESANDRLLVIIGAGHLPILRHCAEASPEYELAEISECL